jgi:hypothetical protein
VRISVALLLVMAAACGQGEKPAYWQTVGAINYPFVQVTQTGAQMGTRTLDLWLEDGRLKVGRDSPSPEIKEATSTNEELARGRALMTAGMLAPYQQASETVTDDQRKARFVVVPPKANTSLSFVARADAPSAPFADLLAYVGELTARYQP